MIKRSMDLIGATVIFLISSPLILGTAALVKCTLGSPVIFKQTRPGLDGKPFELYKFRSMTEKKSKDGKLLTDAERLTDVGKFLRSYSLDELPQLYNVLKGDLSLVGPRPLKMNYLDLYNERQMKRQDVKPGITGWSQVNGRNSISWEEKFELDVWYVENHSLKLDFKILYLTMVKVILREGINENGQATTTDFAGNQDVENKISSEEG